VDCGDRFVTDYVQPKGHQYLDVLVPATEDSLGYTRHICVDCNYSYLSDYVTSGDTGYIPEPEEPVVPEIHQHSYEFYTQNDSDNMSLIVMRVCKCGDTKNVYFNVTFTDEDGNISKSKQAGNKIDYSEFYGQVLISVSDETGVALKTVVVTAQGKPVDPVIPDQPENPTEPNDPVNPVEPEKPTEPNEPNEPNKPDQPDEPNVSDKPNQAEENNGGKGAAVAIFVVMILLAVGGIGGFFLYKKIKAKKQK
jgi:hypothetical protein